MCHDKSHHVLKYLFLVFAWALHYFLCYMSQICSKMVIFLFSAYFGGHFCYHNNHKSRINTKPLHFGYWSNKLIRRNLWKATFIFWPNRGGQNSLLMHVPLYPCPLFSNSFSFSFYPHPTHLRLIHYCKHMKIWYYVNRNLVIHYISKTLQNASFWH